MKRFVLYLTRWQVSTFILAPVVAFLYWLSPWIACSIANLIGGCIFFFIDKKIFTSPKLGEIPIWQIAEEINCSDCDKLCRGYRLVHSSNYDKREDDNPKFRCEECSKVKSEELRSNGVVI